MYFDQKRLKQFEKFEIMLKTLGKYLLRIQSSLGKDSRNDNSISSKDVIQTKEIINLTTQWYIFSRSGKVKADQHEINNIPMRFILALNKELQAANISISSILAGLDIYTFSCKHSDT